MDMLKKLKRFDKTFKTAKKRAHEEGFGGAELPDGKYKARLESCELSESQSSGRMQVCFAFVVTAGEQKGEKVRKYQAVETEDDQVWLARDLKRFGIEAPESAQDLIDTVKLLDESKPELVISLKTKDSGQFCYIDKVTSEIEGGDEDEEESEDDEEMEDSDEESKDETEEEEEEEGEEEENEDEGVEVEVGMEVKFTSKTGKKLSGKVVKVIEDEESVKVKTLKGNFHTVKIEDVELPEAEDEEETEEKPKPRAKAKKGKK